MWLWCASTPLFAWGENIRQPPTFLHNVATSLDPNFYPCWTLFHIFNFKVKLEEYSKITFVSPTFLLLWKYLPGLLKGLSLSFWGRWFFFGQNFIFMVKKQETVLEAPNHHGVLCLLVQRVLSTISLVFLVTSRQKESVKYFPPAFS